MVAALVILVGLGIYSSDAVVVTTEQNLTLAEPGGALVAMLLGQSEVLVKGGHAGGGAVRRVHH